VNKNNQLTDIYETNTVFLFARILNLN